MQWEGSNREGMRGSLPIFCCWEQPQHPALRWETCKASCGQVPSAQPQAADLLLLPSCIPAGALLLPVCPVPPSGELG